MPEQNDAVGIAVNYLVGVIQDDKATPEARMQAALSIVSDHDRHMLKQFAEAVTEAKP